MIHYVKSNGVPPGIAIVIHDNVVIWLGPANEMPDRNWPEGSRVNLCPTDYWTVTQEAAKTGKGSPLQ